MADSGFAARAQSSTSSTLSPPPAAKRTTTTTTTTTTTSTFLWLSDIHYDPFYGTTHAVGLDCGNNSSSSNSSAASTYGAVGCDAPRALLQRMVSQAARLMSNETMVPDFCVLTGDLVRHGNDKLASPWEDTQSILSNVTHILQSTLPNISIIPALGNNDLTPDYYLDMAATETTTKTNPLLNMVAQGLDALFESQAERESFRRGGYLARNVTETLTVLSINTIIYATAHQPKETSLSTKDPLGQWTWLQQELQQIKDAGRVAYIMGHIPPAVGSYRHSQLWHDAYADAYWNVLQRYRHVIRGHFFGHLHSDEFRLLETHDAKDDSFLLWPLWMAPSLTPIYGGNPSMRWVRYSPVTGSLLDYNTYYLDLLGKGKNVTAAAATTTTLATEPPVLVQGPSFGESFNVSDMSTDSLQTILQSLGQTIQDPNSTDWKALIHRQHVYVDADLDSCLDVACRKAWMCVLSAQSKADFEACATGTTKQMNEKDDAKNGISWLVWGLLGAAAGLVVGCLSMFFVFCWRRRCYLVGQQHYHQPSAHATYPPHGLEVAHCHHHPVLQNEYGSTTIRHNNNTTPAELTTIPAGDGSFENGHKSTSTSSLPVIS